MKPPGASSDPRDFIAACPSPVERGCEEARKRLDELVAEKGFGPGGEQLNASNLGEWCEVVTDEIVDVLRLRVENEQIGIQEWNAIFASLMDYAATKHQSAAGN